MSQFTSRNPGLVGAFFDNKNVWGGIIVDGTHSDYACVRVAHAIKKGKLFQVSDASFVKHPINEFEFDGFKIHYKDGKYLTETGNLAGSSISMLDGLQNLVKHVGIDLEEAVKMSATYPAEFLKINNFVGQIKKGSKADLLILDSDLQLEQILVKGEAINLKQII
jgi:N-acetylglucosamine-6-phosphate deacetylase